MLSALERRQEILEALNLRRFETIDRLASEFQERDLALAGNPALRKRRRQ